MPFCPHCGKEILTTDLFCLNCGRSLSPSTIGQVSVQSQQQVPPNAHSQAHSKSPAAAAVLNFFLPGTGYAYVGMSRDVGEVIFGVLVFVFYFIGFEVGVVGDAISAPVAPSTQAYAFAPLILLLFLMPFAFAYDGYRRARSS